MIVVIDTETTDLLNPEGVDISLQPHMIEICALAINEKTDEIKKEFTSLIKPPILIPKHITAITGINDKMVEKAPVFFQVWKKIAKVFLGCNTVVAHNLSFDINILANELIRIGKLYNFPFPPIHFCTVEQSMHIKGYRLKNGELYEILTGRKIENAHRAKNDVLATYESYLKLKN